METKFTNINVNKTNNKEKKIPSLSNIEADRLRKLVSEPYYIKFIKTLIILIPAAIIIYITASHFLINQQFNYVYDIGSEDDNYLSPLQRVSDKISDKTINYRNITSSLVYFDIPIAEGASEIEIDIKFKDNFPDNSKLILGAKNQENWSYYFQTIYSPTIEDLMNINSYEEDSPFILIKTNEKAKNYSIKEIFGSGENIGGIKLATDQNLTVRKFFIPDYTPEKFTIDTALRESPNFYVYVKGDFTVEVEKNDLNWYENPDILEINLYNLNNTLIAKTKIEDDGEKDKEPDKDDKTVQKGKLEVSNLDEGVYRLELKNNADMIIRKITLNQNKIVLKDKVFLASSSVYFNNIESKSKIYFKAEDSDKLKLITYHPYALNQSIELDNRNIKLKEINKEYLFDILYSDNLHTLTSKKNDVIVSAPVLFSFSEDSWFDPFNAGKLAFKDDINYLEKNADYVLVSYKPVINQDENWRIAKVRFNLSGLYIKDNKLNMVFNLPHLNENNNLTKQDYISIDWINITVYKPSKF
ncbi:hypothetical protein HYW74_04220 [Candidatus Pacearchaeota archaeon]|nr:hypothetical protein [Candidatus Pacearchaeota archaeon]